MSSSCSLLYGHATHSLTGNSTNYNTNSEQYATRVDDLGDYEFSADNY